MSEVQPVDNDQIERIARTAVTGIQSETGMEAFLQKFTTPENRGKVEARIDALRRDLAQSGSVEPVLASI